LRSAPRLLASELDPANEEGPEELGRFLSEAQTLPLAARAGLAALIHKEHGQPLAAIVEASYVRGSERRRRLAAALVGHPGGLPSPLPAAIADDIVTQTLASLSDLSPIAPTIVAPPPARVAPAAGPLVTSPAEPSPAAVPGDPPASVAWADRAEAILGRHLRNAAEALARLERKVVLGRALLATVVPRKFRARKAVARAAVLLEEAQFAAGVAKELAPSEPDLPEVVLRAIVARGELVRVRSVLLLLNEVLGRLARRTAGVRPTPGEIGDIDRAALEGREALYNVQAVAELLLDLDRGGSAGALTEGDVRALGLAFELSAPPPQAVWIESAVQALVDPRHDKSSPPGPGRDAALGNLVPVLEGADVLAALKAAGVDLTRVDPGQLRPSARFVSEAERPADRAGRLATAVEAFQILAKLERPRLSRHRMADLLRTVARVPGRALAGLAEGEVRDRFQEIARALNLGPGLLRTKAGAFHLTLVMDEDGRVVRCSCRRRGFVSRLGLTIGRTAAPLGPLVRGPFSAGESIGRTSLIGLARLGAALLRSAARVGDARATGSRPAGTARDDRLPARLSRRSGELESEAVNAAAFASYRKAGPVAAEARRGLTAALTSSDPAAIARAQKRLRQAEDDKREALRRAAAGILGSRPRLAAPPAARARGSAFVPPPPRRLTASLTTGVVLKGLARELRQTQTMIERGRQAAGDLYDIARSVELPEKIRVVAAASAFSVEEATSTFKRELAEAQAEDATQSARLVFERRITGILEDHRQIHLALAALHAREARALFRNIAPPTVERP
jgi:hypothetical protein